MASSPPKTGKTTGLSSDEEDTQATAAMEAVQDQANSNPTAFSLHPPAVSMNLHPQGAISRSQATANPAAFSLNPSAATSLNLPAQDVIEKLAAMNSNAELVKNAAMIGFALAQEQHRKQQLLQSQLAALSVLPHLQSTAFPPNLGTSPGSLQAAASNQLAVSSLLSAASQAHKVSPAASTTPFLLPQSQNAAAAQGLAMLHQAATTPSLASTPMASPYFDASTIPDPKQDLLSKITGKRTRRGGGASEPFPQKLHRMLTDLDKEDSPLTDIACFLPHGRAFLIHNPERFVVEIMPKYFRMSRFSSFQRQLNLYDFKRITDGRDKGGYYHELFLRGRPGLCTKMKRTKIKGSSSWLGRGGLHEEVNFYAMPPIKTEESSSPKEEAKEEDADSKS